MRLMESHRQREARARALRVDLGVEEGGWASGRGVFETVGTDVFGCVVLLRCGLEMGAVC